MNISTLRVLICESMFALTPGNTFWPYFAGVVILAIGLFAIRKELLRARGQEKIITLGPLFFAAPLAVFAAQHFTDTKFVSLLVPAWIPPGRLFWTYFVATCLIAAALSIVVKKQAQLAATLLGTMLILFVLLLHIPNIIAHPGSVFAWALAFRDLAFSGGALAFAGTQTEKWRAGGTSPFITLARIFISVPVIFFGIAHFLHPEFLPAVDLDRSTPIWIPGHTLCAYLAGAMFIAAGASMVLNRRTHLAAKYLGMFVLVLLLFVYLPIVVSKPSDVENGLNYFVSTLAFSGATFLLAAAVPGEDQARGENVPSIRR